MRTIQKIAMIFAITNLVLGGMALFSPFVKSRRDKIRLPDVRFGKRSFKDRLMHNLRSGEIINTRPGMLLGFLGAVNPPHAALHLGLGALGLGTRARSDLSRPYVWLLGALYAVMAAMGWSKVGMQPGIHKMMGFAVDKRDNIIHTIWAAAALFLAAWAGRRQGLFDQTPGAFARQPRIDRSPVPNTWTDMLTTTPETRSEYPRG